MQIFELYFNPRNRQDVLFDTFSYLPQTPSEKTLGRLFLAGYLANASLESPRFLNNLVRVIKNGYYEQQKSHPGKNLKEALKKGNQFLVELTQKGKVAWISNLNFAVLSLNDQLQLNFTKVGHCKILLLRRNKIAEIGQHLELVEIEPYPLKVFSKTATGSLKPQDRILVMNAEIYQHFSSYQVVEKIVREPDLNWEKLNQILKKVPQDIPGFFLLIDLQKKEGESRKVIFKKETTRSFRQFLPVKHLFFPKAAAKAKNVLSQIGVGSLAPPQALVLLTALVGLLLVGGLLAKIEEKNQLAQIENQRQAIEEKLARAEALRAFGEEEEAFTLFSQVWQDLAALPKESLSKKELEEKLFDLNQFEQIDAPEVFLELEKTQPPPEQIFLLGQNFYFLNNLPVLSIKKQDGTLRLVRGENKLIAALPIEGEMLFLSEDKQLLRLVENTFVRLQQFDLSFSLVSSFRSHLYFLEAETGQLWKYQYEDNFIWREPVVWFRPGVEKIKAGQSMAIDGRIWVLDEDNTISSYFKGKREKKFEPRLFPPPVSMSKIYTSSSHHYLYLLEPAGKRVIILSKEGRLIKQYRSEQFDELKDLAVSADEKTIYLLNGRKVYRKEILINQKDIGF